MFICLEKIKHSNLAFHQQNDMSDKSKCFHTFSTRPQGEYRISIKMNALVYFRFQMCLCGRSFVYYENELKIMCFVGYLSKKWYEVQVQVLHEQNVHQPNPQQQKTFELHNIMENSTRWNCFRITLGTLHQ